MRNDLVWLGFVGGLIANTGGTGFLEGYYLVSLLGISFFYYKRVFKGLPKSLDGLKAIFLYPVIGVAVIGITMSLLADPMKAVNEGMMSF